MNRSIQKLMHGAQIKKQLERLESNLSAQLEEFRNQARMIEQEDDRLMANSVRLEVDALSLPVYNRFSLCLSALFCEPE